MDNVEALDLTKQSQEDKPINLLGYGMKQTLQKIEYEMRDLSLTVIMEPFNKNLSKQVYKFKLDEKEEENINIKAKRSDEDLVNLIERIEKRQKEYQTLLDKAKEKVIELQAQYSQKDYQFSIIKRSKKISVVESSTDSESSSDSEPEACRENVTSEPSGSNIKTRCETDPERGQDIQPSCSTQYPYELDSNPDIMIIGPNRTQISRKDLEKIKLKDASGATRELCDIIFGGKILSSHSLSGNRSPAFQGRERPIKPRLDVHKVSDITHLVCDKYNVTHQFVRTSITTKCADAARKLKRQAKKNANKS